MSTFVGRARDRDDLVAAFGGERLITLCGPPGIGKTRLAAEVAAAAVPVFEGGAWVDLASVSEATAVVLAVARALDVHEQEGRTLLDAVVRIVGERRLLVSLDNCEHLVESASTVVEGLLSGCPNVRILATSRQALGIAGERKWDLPPLSVAEAGADVHEVSATEAGQLFRIRARAVSPGFALTPRTGPVVGDICRRLDGIPLAIELAAARVGVLSVDEIRARLENRFVLLGGANRAGWGRNETLVEALDWSYELLTASEKAMLRRLGTFAGPVNFDSVEAVCGGGEVEAEQVLDLLAALRSKSLLEARTEHSPARYRLLETVRAYARRRLALEEDEDAVVGRHIGWYRDLAEKAEPHLTSSHQRDWLERLDGEYDDIVAALRGALDRGHTSDGVRLAGALTLYWRLRGQFSEGLGWLETALSHSGKAETPEGARANWGAGFLALMVGDLPKAESLLAKALSTFRRLGDAQGQARSLLLVGNSGLTDQQVGSVISTLEESIALAREAGDIWCLAHALALAAKAHIGAGDRASARAALHEALAAARQATEPQSLRIVLLVLGEMAVWEGHYQAAQPLLQESMAISRHLGETYGMAAALHLLGEVAAARGDYARARQLVEESVTLGRATGGSNANSLAFLGRMALDEGDISRAHTLLNAAGKAAGTASPDLLLATGSVAMAEGDLQGARAALEHALAAAEALGHTSMVAGALNALAFVDRAQGEHARAEARHCQALEMREAIGEGEGVAECLEALGLQATETGDHEKGARLFAAAEARRGPEGFVRPPRLRAWYRADLQRMRSALGSEAFEAAWAQGAALTHGEAVAYAMGAHGRRGRPASGWNALTRAEREVANLAAEGLTNRQIGERRFISPHTVKRHLASIFAKLGVSSRFELTNEVRAQAPDSSE